MNLNILGWNPYWQSHFKNLSDSDSYFGRVSSQHRNIYRVFTERGEVLAQVSGRLQYNSLASSDYPVVGDWVVLQFHSQDRRAVIQAILPRRSRFSRQAAGTVEEEQVLAANIDTVFIVSALNRDFNLRRLERYLVLTWESGALPVIILNKADLCDDVEQRIVEVSNISPGVPIHGVSCETGYGLDQLEPYLEPGRTVVLLGSSGVGKSTLLNRFMNKSVQKTQTIREHDSRGRHTTTHRQMHLLSQGGLVIDTPGLRELRLWDVDAGLASTFEDIESWSLQCHFSDCQHQGEPGCAVAQALETGKLDPARFNSYLKLQKELAYFSRKENLGEARAEKAKWKAIHKEIKRLKKR